MKKHLLYLKYVLRHKWFVYKACRITRAPFWRSVIHDWSKFMPCEWFPYVEYFYGSHFKWSETHGDARNILHYKGSQEYWSSRFDVAWNHHQKFNKHHWQYYFLTNDSDSPKHQPLPMPEKYIREMVADWVGAGIAINGRMEVGSWYLQNRDNIVLFADTRYRVEELIAQVENYYRVGRMLGMSV